MYNVKRYGHFDPNQEAMLEALIHKAKSIMIVVLNYSYEQDGEQLKPSSVFAQKASLLKLYLALSLCTIVTHTVCCSGAA